MSMIGLWFAVGIAIFLVLVSGAGCIMMWLQINKKDLFVVNQLKHLKNEINTISNGTLGVGKRLANVEKRLNLTVEKQTELQHQDLQQLPYTQAARLAEMGATTGDLMDSCGLSRAEAELVETMHKQVDVDA